LQVARSSQSQTVVANAKKQKIRHKNHPKPSYIIEVIGSLRTIFRVNILDDKK